MESFVVALCASVNYDYVPLNFQGTSRERI